MSLDLLENDFFGDLCEDTHGVWEVFEFVRLHSSELDDLQVFRRGMHYIMRWHEASWIQLAKVPLYPTTLTSLDQTLKLLEEQGAAATKYFSNAPSLDITANGIKKYKNAER